MHYIEGNPHEPHPSNTGRHYHVWPYKKGDSPGNQNNRESFPKNSSVNLRERRKIVLSTDCVLYHLHGLKMTGEVYCFGVFRTAHEAERHADDKLTDTTKFEVVEVRQ